MRCFRLLYRMNYDEVAMKKRTLLAGSVVFALLVPLVSSSSGLAAGLRPTTLYHPREHNAISRSVPQGSALQPSPYNTPFLTDAELEDHNAMSVEQIRSFLASYGSYFGEPVADVDHETFDPPAVIAQAARQHRINPRVLLVTLEKESNGVTRSTRPPDATMKFLMGCVSPSTARQQLTCAAERFRAYHDQLTSALRRK